MPGSGRRPRWWIAVAAALLAAVPAFTLSFVPWPEMVATGYFITHGFRLYRDVFIPETPGLPLMVAAIGKALGFTTTALRSVAVLPLAASGALLGLGVRSRRLGLTLAGTGTAVAVLVLSTVYAEGPAIWPDPAVAPFLLGGALLLERWHGRRARSSLMWAGLTLGAAVLVKQTALWGGLGAIAWLLAGRRRQGIAPLLRFSLWLAAPFLGFACAWGLAFHTLDHLRWTVVVPVFSNFAHEVAAPVRLGDLPEAVVLFFPIVALALCRWLLPARIALSPVAWMAVPTALMAWPRGGLLHFSGALGLVALAAGRVILAGAAIVKRWYRRSFAAGRLAGLAAAGALVITHAAVVGSAGLSFAASQFGAPILHWNDSRTRALARNVADHVPRAGEFLNYSGSWDTVYPLTGTLPLGRIWANPMFWWILDEEGIDRRSVRAYRRRPGALVLYSEPNDAHVKETAVYRFLSENTEDLQPGGQPPTWRRIR
jgi:hypothetical protein